MVGTAGNMEMADYKGVEWAGNESINEIIGIDDINVTVTETLTIMVCLLITPLGDSNESTYGFYFIFLLP